MARGKVQIRRIENTVHRQVTFCKRRSGLFKKAKELSVLCDADIGIVVFSAHGKLYELATMGSMGELIERYKRKCEEDQGEGSEVTQPQDVEQELTMLKQEINQLQKSLRYMFGEAGAGPMTLEELLALERHLDTWMHNIRAAKMRVMLQEIQSLKNKEGVLKAANELLQEKIVEQSEVPGVVDPLTIQHNGFFNLTPIVEKHGFFDAASVIAGIPYPLTIPNGISHF